MTNQKAAVQVEESQDQIINLISNMKKDGYLFNENPAVFKWAYQEHPELELTLIIKNSVDSQIGGALGTATLQ